MTYDRKFYFGAPLWFAGREGSHFLVEDCSTASMPTQGFFKNIRLLVAPKLAKRIDDAFHDKDLVQIQRLRKEAAILLSCCHVVCESFIQILRDCCPSWELFVG